MAIDHKHIQDAVRKNVEMLVAQLNRELELAELVRLNIAIDADNTIGRPVRVAVVPSHADQETPYGG